MLERKSEVPLTCISFETIYGYAPSHMSFLSLLEVQD